MLVFDASVVLNGMQTLTCPTGGDNWNDACAPTTTSSTPGEIELSVINPTLQKNTPKRTRPAGRLIVVIVAPLCVNWTDEFAALPLKFSESS